MRTQAEREAVRERIRQHALANAARVGITFRCQMAGDDTGQHRACRGESPGGAGCLCRCHDNPGVITER